MSMLEGLGRLSKIAERYAGLMSAVPDAILFIGSDNVIQECNDHVTKVTGYDAEELEGATLDKLMPSGSHRQFFDDFLESGQTEIDAHRDVSIRKKGGECVPVRISRSFFKSHNSTTFVAIIYPL